MDISRHFTTRKNARATLDRQNRLKKSADSSPSVSRASPSSDPVDNVEKVGRKKDDVTEAKKNDLLSRWAASNARDQTKATEKKESTPKTLLQFKNDPKRTADLNRALNSFSSDVAKLQKTPEKLQSSPFYAFHKESLTSEQATAKLRHNHSLRRKLFSPSKKTLAEKDEAEPSTSNTEEPSTPPSSPVKGGRNERMVDAAEDVTRSPGKRVLLFSPSKGSVHSVIKTAAQLHSDSVREGLSAAVGGDSKDAFAYRLAEIGSTKRKAEYDRSEIRKKIAKVAAAKTKVHLSDLAESSKPSLPTVPAYQRFAEDVKKKLLLPSPFKDVYNLFERMDRNVATFHNRAETCWFEKLDDSLKPFLGRSLSQNDLGQVKAVFPKAYVFNVEKPPSLLASPGVSQKSLNDEHLVIYIRDDKKPDDATVPEDNFRLRSPVGPADLVRRRDTLYSCLLHIVYQEHRNFVHASHPSAVVEDRDIERWHPQFLIEEVQLPPPAVLPQFKRPLVSRTAAEVLAMTQQLKARLEERKFGKEGASTSKVEEVKTVEVSSKATPKELKRIDPKFLARVRERQAANMMKTITRDPGVDKKIRMLERLPEMGRIMLNHYSSERKTVLEQSSVFGALKLSTKLGLSAEELKEHMDLLIEVFRTRWIEQLFLQNKHFLKITDSTTGVSEIDKIVQDEIAKLK